MASATSSSEVAVNSPPVTTTSTAAIPPAAEAGGVQNGHFVNGDMNSVSEASHLPPNGDNNSYYSGQYPVAQKPYPPGQHPQRYPPPPGGQGTPTLNSLLQGRNSARPPPPGPPSHHGQYGPPPPGYGPTPQGWGQDPGYYNRHPGARPPYGPPSPHSYGPPPPHHQYPPHQYPYPGYPPQQHGRYPPPPQSQQQQMPPNSTNPSSNSGSGTVTTSSTSTVTTASSAECPPPHPGCHEGRPSTTWTPPVQKSDNGESQAPPPQESSATSAASAKPHEDSNDAERSGVRPPPSPTGSSSSRSMSPAVQQQQMPPRPPSSNQQQSQQEQPKMASASPQPPHQQPPQAGPPQPPGGGYPPQHPPMGPPQHMPHYGGPPGSQPPGYYGMRMGGPGGYGPPNSGPGGYPGYGRQNNIPPSGYPQPPQPQQHYGAGWNNGPPPPGPGGQPGMGPPGSKGQRPNFPPPQRPGHPHSQQPMMKGGYPPPNSYNGPPNYNGPPAPGMQPPSSGASGYPPYPNYPPPPNSSSNSMPPVSSQSGPTPTSIASGNPSSSGPVGPDGFDESSQQSTLSQSSDRSDGGRQTPKGPQQGPPPHSNQQQPQHPHNYMPGNYPPGSPHSSAPSPGGSMGSSGAGPDGGYPRDGMASPSWQRPPASPVSTPQMNNFGAGQQLPSPSAAGPSSTPSSRPSKTSSRSSDSLSRLYEMDEHPDRRVFLDKLLSFMEEKGSPITQCPTISKNPLDLFRLYLYTKERGGYLECTKQKTWKDIAAQLGIGASSSGAYTLKKHYGKNLLPFECYYDRGGIDPGPILAQVEAQTKKKTKAPSQPQPPPAPSPGSQDSRDSYSNSNSGMNASDHYGSYPPPPGAPGSYGNYPPPPGQPHGPSSGPPPPGGVPPNSTADGRPPSHPGMQPVKEPIRLGNPFDDGGLHQQISAAAQGMPPGSYPPTTGYGGYPNHHHNRPDGYPGGGYPPSQYPPPQRPGWPPHQQPPYGPPPPANGGPPTSSAPNYPPGYYGPRPAYTPPTSSAASPIPATSAPPPQQPPQQPGGPPPNQNPYGQPPYQEPYQQKQPPPVGGPPPSHLMAPTSTVSSVPPQGPPPPGAKPILTGPPPRPPGPPMQAYGASNSPSTSNSGPPPPQGYPVKPMGPQSQPPRPPPPGGAPPNAYSYPGQRPPMYPGQPQPQGWQNRYPGPSPGYPDNRQWGPQGPPPRMPPGAPPPQWGADNRSGYPGPYSGQQSWMRPGMRPPYRPPDPRSGPMQGMPPRPSYHMGRGFRHDMNYPQGSVEATMPLMMKRRKYTKVDVQPVDGWRLVLALRSGLLMESTWALDVINILLYDDYAVTYFGLGNMPGLLEALLEHWRASLIAMFGITEDLEATTERSADRRTRKRQRVIECAKAKKWHESSKDLELHVESSRFQEELDEADVDSALGCVRKDRNTKDNVTVLTSKQSFTKRPRFSDEDVEVFDHNNALFIEESDHMWDNGSDLIAQGGTHWDNGGGNTTEHIVTHFAADLGLVPFVRLLRDLGKKLKQEKKEVEVDKPCNREKPKENGEIKFEEEDIEEASEEEDKLCKKEADAKEQPEKPKEDIIEKIKRLTGITVNDPDKVRERWAVEALEDENYVRDEPSLHLVSEANDNLGKRAVCLSTIFRNLSFVPGNEYELAHSAPFLAICGRLLLLKHWHPPRNAKKKNYDRGEEEETIESCTSLTGDDEWWWDYLHVIRENVMVALSNIAGSLELNIFDEDISRPIFNGLLEWAVSTSAYAQDPFPNVGPHSPISPQGLAIETLCKLCLHETNVDLMLSTPPYKRIEKLILGLAKKLNRYENQVLREFSINLLYYLSAADSGVARTIALSDLTIGLLLGFIEQAEQNAMVIAQKHGVNALRDNPDSMGTSLDMMRRAASTLSNLSRHPDNIVLFMRHEQRLLDLVMSQILDQGVASILSHVLFNIGVHSNLRMATSATMAAMRNSAAAS